MTINYISISYIFVRLQVDSKQRITVRNLRIREDTAKYLRNLDPNSAYYDPKTRSMRDNPDPAAAEWVENCMESFENQIEFFFCFS